MSSLDERIAAATAPAWRPEPGERIEQATVVRLMKGSTDDYGEYPIVLYRLQDGSYMKVHAFHSILRENLAELKTAPGVVQNLAFLDKKTANKVKANGETTEYYLYYVENYDPKKTDKEDISGIDEGFKF